MINVILLVGALAGAVEPVRYEAATESAVTERAVIVERHESHYPGWSEAAKVSTEFPSGIVPFRPPVKALMLELTDPAEADALAFQAVTARLNGFAVYFGYTPRRAGLETFAYADVLAAIEKVAKECGGFAPAYRRSGAHYNRIDANIAAQFCQAARRGNAKIQLLGEAYFGELYSGEVRSGVAVFTFPGCAAVLGVNVKRSAKTEVDGLPVIDVYSKAPNKRFPYHVFADISSDN